LQDKQSLGTGTWELVHVHVQTNNFCLGCTVHYLAWVLLQAPMTPHWWNS